MNTLSNRPVSERSDHSRSLRDIHHAVGSVGASKTSDPIPSDAILPFRLSDMLFSRA
jgi:hypothetical protein